MAKKNTAEEVDYSKPLKNKKHERFCQEYHKTLNATQSYQIAYPKSSLKAADGNGTRLIGNDRVDGRIAYLQSQLSKVCGVDAERLIEEWKKIAFLNAKTLVSDGNTIKNIARMPDEVTAAISSISISKTAYGKNVKITICSKEKALEEIGKLIGAYEKHNKQQQTNLADFLKAMKDG